MDKDTFWLDSRDVSIRVWGLDAPERGRPGGTEATATLARMIGGERLTCREATSTATAGSSGNAFCEMAPTWRCGLSGLAPRRSIAGIPAAHTGPARRTSSCDHGEGTLPFLPAEQPIHLLLGDAEDARRLAKHPEPRGTAGNFIPVGPNGARPATAAGGDQIV